MNTKEINKALKQKFSELERVELNLSKDANTVVFNLYSRALNEVQKELKSVYAQFGSLPTITQLRKYNRLSQLETSLMAAITGLQNEATSFLKSAVQTTSKFNFAAITKALQDGSNAETVFSPLWNQFAVFQYADDSLWIDALNTHNVKLYSDVKREIETVLRANAKEEVIAGLVQGKSYQQISKVLQERFNIAAKRAQVITTTEMHKAQMYGRNAVIQEAQQYADDIGLKVRKIWRHNGIGDPRPSHQAADGQEADKDGFFHVGGEKLQAPGLGTDPANNINCHCTVELVLDEEEKTKTPSKKLKKSKSPKVPSQQPKTIKEAEKVIQKVEEEVEEIKKVEVGDDFASKQLKEVDAKAEAFAKKVIQKHKDSIDKLRKAAMEAAKKKKNASFFLDYIEDELEDELMFGFFDENGDNLRQAMHREIVYEMKKVFGDETAYLYHEAQQDWFVSSTDAGGGILKYFAQQLNGGRIYYHYIPTMADQAPFLDSNAKLLEALESYILKEAPVKLLQERRLKPPPTEQWLKGLRFAQKVHQQVLKEIFGDNTIKVYRGVTHEYLQTLNIKNLKKGQKLTIAENPVASWSFSPEVAHAFTGSEGKGGVIFEAEVSIDEFIGSFLTMDAIYVEQEALVSFRNGVKEVKVYAADIKGDESILEKLGM